MTQKMFHADCQNCAALCCLALAFDKSERFGFDKAAGVACPNLDAAGLCRIHTDLDGAGFSGCRLYDCQGAGQRVTQEVFQGQSWQDRPELMLPMIRAFADMRRVQELACNLTTAKGLNLPPEHEAERQRLLLLLEPAGGWTIKALDSFVQGQIGAVIGRFLTSLRSFVPD
ncbi:MAG: hypothetical protein KDA67_08625 [Rhodobacteraceae bacterium]|nr:hypothetical protein [Paracoccaceae bacterium]